MRVSFPVGASVAFVGALLAAQSAQAAVVSKTINSNPATACMLSIPTTDTGVRPRATGFRNESGVTNFVICGFDIQSATEGFLNATLGFASVDGTGHVFNCTGMDRYAYSTSGDYSTKSVSVPAGGTTSVQFVPADFPANGLSGWNFSVTCVLPVGVSITTVQAGHNDEVGQ